MDLAVSLVAEQLAVGGRFDYLADLCPPRSVAQLATDFMTVLRDAAAHPERRLSQLLPGRWVDQPSPVPAAAPEAPASRAPAEVERAVCAIWAETVGVDRVEPDDDFFEIGGYSLLALQIIARIQERFGVALTVRQFFEHPSVAELSRLLS